MKAFLIWFMSFFSFNKGRNYPKNRKTANVVSRRHWKTEEIERLQSMFDYGNSLMLMSAVLSRTEPAIRAKLYDLGLAYIESKQRLKLEQHKKDALIKEQEKQITASSVDHLEPEALGRLSKLTTNCQEFDPSLHEKHLYLDPLIKPIEPQASYLKETKPDLSNSGALWTEEDDNVLKTLHAIKTKYHRIADILKRSDSAVLNRHSQLGLLPYR